tara:strand:- start:184 stop:357 length:174 start_codon:yes stop_codon:yes gene_type:complete
MTTAFEIKLFNEETHRYHFLAMIEANTKDEALQKFIKRNNYEAKPGFRLFVKSPGCL